MLYLNPPFHIINGVSVFSDHADPLQWYFLPLAPKLTQIPDPVAGAKVPQLQLLKFRGQAGTGGFLNFDVNIGVEESALDDLRMEIKRMQRLRDPPRLAPVPLADGSVKVMLLGQQTGTPPAPGGTGGSGGTATPPPAARFVIKMDHHAKPSLYGDNQAAFSITLDQDGVVMLEKALQGEMSPIGIVYVLDYLALRPAFSVRLKVDWDRVQDHLDEQFGLDTIFTSINIENAVDKLIEKRAIVLEVDTFVPEGDDASGVLGRRDQAINDVRDMITDAFFTPSLEPVKEQEDGWDKALHVAERVGAIAATGGWGGVGKFSYKKVHYTRIDKKVLNVNMSERTTVKRTICPQGHLSGLFRVLRDGGLDLGRFVTAVDLDDPWFQRRRVNVISRGNFEEDGLSSLNVTLRYGNEPKNVILEGSTAKASIDWASILANGGIKRPVEASYKVNFKSVDGTERPASLQSPVATIDTENLEVNPRDLYAIMPVEIDGSGCPWDRYSRIEVRTRYEDAANNIRIGDSFLLDKAKPTQTWRLFVLDRNKTQYAYKLIYRAVNLRDVEQPWVEADDERIVASDPFPLKRTLRIVPNFNWGEVERAFVDVSYEDPDNAVTAEDSFEFTEAAKETKAFVVDLKDPQRTQVGFSATVIFKDGRMVEIPPSVTLAPRIVVRADMKGHRVVRIKPPAIDFGQKGLAHIIVDLRYDDPETGVSVADQFQFKSSDGRAHFEFDYADEQKDKYEYRLTYLQTNGLERATDWQVATNEELRIPAA